MIAALIGIGFLEMNPPDRLQNDVARDYQKGIYPQDWNEIVRQFAELAANAGLQIEHKTVVVNEQSWIVYRIKDAHECPECAHPNLDTDRCYNPQCSRFVLESNRA